MKKFIVVGLVIAPLIVFCQPAGSKSKHATANSAKAPVKKPISEDSLINKWLHATIGIQSKSNFGKLQAELRRLEQNKLITRKHSGELYDSLMGARPEGWGTAIFFQKGKHFYLLTARHVVEDTTGTESNEINSPIMLIETPSTLNKDSGTYIKDTVIGTITIRNLFAGKTDAAYMHPRGYSFDYEFSSVDDDLAIISLDNFMAKGMLKGLRNKGYRPINFDDIDTLTTDILKGEKVICIGFPQDLSELGQWGRNPALLNLESDFVRIPIVTKGMIVDTNFSVKKISKISANVFVNHGNSGGPLINIRTNKLIGIDNALVSIPRMYSKEVAVNQYFMMYPVFNKTKLIRSLLEKLESKLSASVGMSEWGTFDK